MSFSLPFRGGTHTLLFCSPPPPPFPAAPPSPGGSVSVSGAEGEVVQVSVFGAEEEHGNPRQTCTATDRQTDRGEGGLWWRGWHGRLGMMDGNMRDDAGAEGEGTKMAQSGYTVVTLLLQALTRNRTLKLTQWFPKCRW